MPMRPAFTPSIGHRQPAADGAEPVVVAHANVVEHHHAGLAAEVTDGVDQARHREARRARVDEETGDAALVLRGRLEVSQRKDHGVVGIRQELVIHCLMPSSTQCSPSRTARAFMANTSEPASGSLSAKHSVLSPLAMPSR